ncbi:MAG: peptidoglycan-binding domain-containing protein [Minisyncoccota bacterium]
MISVKSHISRRIFAIFMMMVVLAGSAPVSVSATLSVDLKANGEDSLTLVNPSADFEITLATTDASSCQMTLPDPSGISTSASFSVSSLDENYPSPGGSTTYEVTCLDATGVSVSDSVTVSLGESPDPTIDVKANGSDGPITLTDGETYTYTWTSSNSTSCEQTSPETSGISLSGSSETIGTGHSYYPSEAFPITITVVCTDGTENASDSVTIQFDAGVDNGGGGDGGGTPSVDLKANGSDGSITLNSGDTYTYTWVSEDSTSCEQTSPATSGISLSGSSEVIGVGHSYYPAEGSLVTITVVCTDGNTNASDSFVINLTSGCGGNGTPTLPSIDLKANGSDGPVTLTDGETYTYTWSSANSTSCEQTSPATSGVSLSGSSETIGSGHSYYPTEGSPITITVVCTDGSNNASDSVIIQFDGGDDNGGGGNGGGDDDDNGGGGGSRRRNTPDQDVPELVCPLIQDYMRKDFNNDPIEVMKLQAFLKVYMNYDYVTINGSFDEATYTAVGAFQARYAEEILTPWGHTAPTHYVYMLTLKKVNEIFCDHSVPLTSEQQQEIVSFRTLMEQGKAPAGVQVGSVDSIIDSTTAVIPITSTTTVGVNIPVDKEGSQGQIFGQLTSILFSGPESLKDKMQCIYEFSIIIIVLYVLASVLRNVLYADVPHYKFKRFVTKWVTIILGLLGSIVGAYLLEEFCLLLPLLIALLLSLSWMILYPKHESMKSMIKSATTVTIKSKEEKPEEGDK